MPSLKTLLAAALSFAAVPAFAAITFTGLADKTKYNNTVTFTVNADPGAATTTATLDGVPAAGIICGAFGSSLHALHIVYDQRVSELAPGSAMLLMGMRQAIAGRCAFFNLLSGFGYYKVRWLAQATPTCVGQIYRVGSLLYWRRLFGDMKRRLWPARANDPTQSFNPVRRDAEAREAGPVARPPWTAEEAARVAALIAQARAGQGEFLSGDALAAVMPVELRRGAGVRPLRVPAGPAPLP